MNVRENASSFGTTRIRDEYTDFRRDNTLSNGLEERRPFRIESESIRVIETAARPRDRGKHR